MADQGIEARPFLYRKYPRHCFCIGGVCPQAVDRLGAERDQRAGPKQYGGAGQSWVIGAKNFGHIRADSVRTGHGKDAHR